MRAGIIGFAMTAAGFASASASAQGARGVEIPAGDLRSAITLLAVQTQTSIALSDPSLGRLVAPRVKGRLTALEALRKLVASLPVRVVVIDATTFRLVPASRRSAKVRPQRPLQIEPLEATADDIVVTASKRDTRLSNYAGAAFVVPGDSLRLDAGNGTDALEYLLPSLSSTHLGSGRDKLFVRGIGDSSFSGQTQATVGQYFGEARLNFSGPDPDLRLYDVASVELVPGPQGTLYGAGSLGGVIRIVPKPPDSKRVETTILMSGSSTRSGDAGYEAAAVMNWPLSDGMAVRALAYRSTEGGYIDDDQRGLANVNDMAVTGGRIAYRANVTSNWTVDLGALFQRIAAQDAQYADRSVGPLARRSAIAQPFSNAYSLGYANIRYRGPDIEAVLSGSLASSDAIDRSDATAVSGVPSVLQRRSRSGLATWEARAGSSSRGNFSWVVGVSSIGSRLHQSRSLSGPDMPQSGASTRASAGEIALFAEAARAAGPFQLTVGARAAHWRATGRAVSETNDVALDFSGRGTGWRVLPQVAGSVRLIGHVSLFARYAESYRAPTAVVNEGGGIVLKGDRYRAFEFGLRFPQGGGRTFDGSVTASLGRWQDVQADIIDSTGFIATSNIGNARVFSLEVAGRLAISPNLSVTAAATLNQTSVVHDQPSNIIVINGRLPNVPDIGANATASYEHPLGPDRSWKMSGLARYVGKSRLGVGPVLGQMQGGFFETRGEVSVRMSRLTIFVRGDNLLDSKGSRFALGSIAGVGSQDQFVPLRPRRIVIGFIVNTPAF